LLRPDRVCDWLLAKAGAGYQGRLGVKRPEVRPGGWAFQYNNAYYPDLDDTAVVVMAMDRTRRATGSHEYDTAIARGREWIEGMQSRDGGWAAFDVNNLEYYLNNIPFSDHGALLDPPTEDVTARCVSMLAQLGETAQTNKAVAADCLSAPDPACGGIVVWPLGMNYIYGTWSVLCALNAAGSTTRTRRFARPWPGWSRSRTRTGAGARMPPAIDSTIRASRGLLDRLANGMGLACTDGGGRGRHPAVARGVEYLIATQTEKGLWDEQRFTATGFPRVFYLRYHGYSKFFPLWALARYRNLRKHQQQAVGVGM
jgi:squalene-hopene/tetraprenyl-beta-curcumene cyclase